MPAAPVEVECPIIERRVDVEQNQFGTLFLTIKLGGIYPYVLRIGVRPYTSLYLQDIYCASRLASRIIKDDVRSIDTRTPSNVFRLAQ